MKTQPRRNPTTFTRSAKVGVTLFSLATLVSGWNVVGHRQAISAQALANEPGSAAPAATATPWPTIVPLPTFEPIPTLQPLNPLFTADSMGDPFVGQGEGDLSLDNSFTLPALPSLNPLPTLAPLPAMPVMPAPPPPSNSHSSSKDSGSNSSSSNSSSGKKSGGS